MVFLPIPTDKELIGQILNKNSEDNKYVYAKL